MSNVIPFPPRHGLTQDERNVINARFPGVEFHSTDIGSIWASLEGRGVISREYGEVLWFPVGECEPLITSPSLVTLINQVSG